jgi:hypothetical protein
MENPYWLILENNIKLIGDHMNTELLTSILNHLHYTQVKLLMEKSRQKLL